MAHEKMPAHQDEPPAEPPRHRALTPTRASTKTVESRTRTRRLAAAPGSGGDSHARRDPLGAVCRCDDGSQCREDASMTTGAAMNRSSTSRHSRGAPSTSSIAMFRARCARSAHAYVREVSASVRSSPAVPHDFDGHRWCRCRSLTSHVLDCGPTVSSISRATAATGDAATACWFRPTGRASSIAGRPSAPSRARPRRGAR